VHVACTQIPPRPSEEHVKILVVGERGVGKTTLLQNLLVSYGGACVFEQVRMPMELIAVVAARY
jgi:predicted GTPase